VITEHSQIPLDVHLIIEKPERYIKEFITASNSILTIHLEATQNPKATLQKIKSYGAVAGISISPAILMRGLWITYMIL
ncbi:Ribulose-phosphate 3-epimerase, partial [Hyalomma marginatum]